MACGRNRKEKVRIRKLQEESNIGMERAIQEQGPEKQDKANMQCFRAVILFLLNRLEKPLKDFLLERLH